MLCSYVTYEAKFFFYTVILTSLILQAQGVRRAWVGDYDTLPQFICIANKQAVHMNIIMWYTSLQAKWENNHIIIFISQLFVCILQGKCKTAVNTDILLRLHTSSPLAPLSEHQRAQDTLRTDEPSPSIPLFEHWKGQHIQREAGYTFTAYFKC